MTRWREDRGLPVTACGKELDRLGNLVGMQRCPSVSDIDFRNAILAHIRGHSKALEVMGQLYSPETPYILPLRFQQIMEEIEDADHGPN